MSSTADPREIAQRLYDAMAARDLQGIRDSLEPEFLGEVSQGMPLGVGGRHRGREAMLQDVWAPIFKAYDVRLDVERYIANGDEVVVLGHYRGASRSDGAEFSARFVHVLTVSPAGIKSLEQITDTASWTAA